MNGWMTKVSVSVASYGSVDEWIVGWMLVAGVFVLTLHVHDCLHTIRDGMHIASKSCTCCICLALSQLTMFEGHSDLCFE